jgi:hypothetical protein
MSPAFLSPESRPGSTLGRGKVLTETSFCTSFPAVSAFAPCGKVRPAVAQIREPRTKKATMKCLFITSPLSVAFSQLFVSPPLPRASSTIRPGRVSLRRWHSGQYRRFSEKSPRCRPFFPFLSRNHRRGAWARWLVNTSLRLATRWRAFPIWWRSCHGWRSDSIRR